MTILRREAARSLSHQPATVGALPCNVSNNGASTSASALGSFSGISRTLKQLPVWVWSPYATPTLKIWGGQKGAIKESEKSDLSLSWFPSIIPLVAVFILTDKHKEAANPQDMKRMRTASQLVRLLLLLLLLLLRTGLASEGRALVPPRGFSWNYPPNTRLRGSPFP